MEIVHENGDDDKPDLSQSLHDSQLRNDALLSELNSLRNSYEELRSRSVEMEEKLINLQKQKDEALKSIEEISSERDYLQRKLQEAEVSAREREDELVKKEEDEEREKLEFGRRISELTEESGKKTRVLFQSLDSVNSIKDCLLKIIDRMDEGSSDKIVEEIVEAEDLDEELKKFWVEIRAVDKLSMLVESRFMEYEEKRQKEKRELENSVVSLTEENRDINSLLRISIVEKDAVEKTLSRLKGGGEQKKVPLLQIAERGLQKVGFGFMMSAPAGDLMEISGSDTCGKSETSECEEEVVSLASTVEKVMKNLRLEITQLRISLDDSRSDNERLQSLTEKQSQQIAESTSYIKDLEERESRLAQNIEQLMMEITGADEEITRWREACELEVEAGKTVIGECEQEARILREELDKTRAALEMLNKKVKLKEELAAAAMAAQEAGQKSLHLADSRAAQLCERIEELTRQLDEADNRGERTIRRKVRYICWPWLLLRANPGDPRRRNVRTLIPEMQGLVHDRI